MRLYLNGNHPTRWFAFSQETGWVTFPAEIGGWPRREAARGLDPINLREVPVRLGFTTGIPGAQCVFEKAA